MSWPSAVLVEHLSMVCGLWSALASASAGCDISYLTTYNLQLASHNSHLPSESEFSAQRAAHRIPSEKTHESALGL